MPGAERISEHGGDEPQLHAVARRLVMAALLGEIPREVATAAIAECTARLRARAMQLQTADERALHQPSSGSAA